jgi:hypothetical protein
VGGRLVQLGLALHIGVVRVLPCGASSFRGAEGSLAPAGQVRLEIVRTDEIFHVQERRALQPDIDESGLKPGKNARHLAEVDVADGSAARMGASSFDVKFGDDAALDERDPRLGEVARNDENILGHTMASFPARDFESPPEGARPALPSRPRRGRCVRR